MSDDLAHLAACSPAELDAWLRGHLSRRVVVLLLAPATELSSAQEWASGFGVYGELRISARGVSEVSGALAEALAEAALLDPDAVVIWLTGRAEGGLAWARAVLGAIEDVGARDRWLCLLAGPGAVRTVARQLGYEDGLPPEMPVGQGAALLARAAVANEAFRRRGSSPPCYLE